MDQGDASCIAVPHMPSRGISAPKRPCRIPLTFLLASAALVLHLPGSSATWVQLFALTRGGVPRGSALLSAHDSLEVALLKWGVPFVAAVLAFMAFRRRSRLATSHFRRRGRPSMTWGRIVRCAGTGGWCGASATRHSANNMVVLSAKASLGSGDKASPSPGGVIAMILSFVIGASIVFFGTPLTLHALVGICVTCWIWALLVCYGIVQRQIAAEFEGTSASEQALVTSNPCQREIPSKGFAFCKRDACCADSSSTQASSDEPEDVEIGA